MNNLLSYCGLIDAKIRASDKDLSVQFSREPAQTMRLNQPAEINPKSTLMEPYRLR